MSEQNNYELAVKGIKTSSLSGRLFRYLVLYIPITIAWVWITTANGLDDYKTWEGYGINSDFLSFLVISIMLLPTAIPFLAWEISVRNWRKKHDLSVWKNIEEDLKQMAVDKQIAREQKALKKYEEK